MTGMWPHVNGCTHNSVPLDRRFRVFPELMQDRDYRTAYIGKWHLGEDGPAGRGFQHYISTDGHGDYSKFLISKGVAPDKANGRFSEVAISNLPIELSRPKFLEKYACDFIEKHQRDPFILVVAFVEPHSPYNGPLNDVNPLDEVKLDARPIVGGVTGTARGPIAGLEATVSAGRFDYYIEAEHVNDRVGGNYNYAWTELGWRPVEWLRVGFAGQHSRVYGTERETQRGGLVQFTRGDLTFSAYWFNPGTSDQIVIGALGISF